MRDGVKIAVDLHLPDHVSKETKLPTILHQTRYYRSYMLRWPFSLIIPNDLYAAIRRRFLQARYAWMSVDVRGSGASYGFTNSGWTDNQVRDAREIVHWIVNQPWSNGAVGGYGSSYEGTCAELLLVDKLPALRAIIPSFTPFDYYADICRPGGILLSWFLQEWGDINRLLDENAYRVALDLKERLVFKGVTPVDEDSDGAMAAQAVINHSQNWNVYETLCRIAFREDTLDYDLDWRIDNLSPHTLVNEFRSSEVPIYSYSGWFDGAYPRAAVKRYLLVTTPGSKLMLGPWDHNGLHNVSPTSLGKARFDHTAEALEFFDYYCKGIETALVDAPPVRYYTMIEDRWKSSETWPPTGFERLVFYLDDGARLSRQSPADTNAADTYQTSASTGSGVRSRWRSLRLAVADGIYYPDRMIRDRELLVYTSNPLPNAVEVTGHPLVRLYIEPSRDDCYLFAYLEDIDPKGNITYVTEGQLRALHKQLTAEEESLDRLIVPRAYTRDNAAPLVPGKIIEVTFDLIPTSYLFRKGHAIRIAIAGADRDHFSTPPGEPPQIRIMRNTAHPSCVELPGKISK